MKKAKEITLILHNIRSVHNVGAIFRTAECAGATKIFLTGYTPAPVDKFGKVLKEVAKTALGAEEWVKWEKTKNINLVIKNLKLAGFNIVAVEQDKKSILYKKLKPAPKTAYIFGNEVTGISSSALKKADTIIEVPLHGKKESLNVSTTVGIILFK